jgi:hypothetical protein
VILFSSDIIITSYFEVRILENKLELLPFGHSRHYPLTFDVNTRDVFSGTINFFNQPLLKHFNQNNFIDPRKCEIVVSQLKKSLIVMNLLDNCFGHALLKLFNAVQQIEINKEKYDFLLILPRSLKHFIKTNQGINVIFVALSFAELEKCFVLNKEIRKISEVYDHIFLIGAETYAAFDFSIIKQKLLLLNASTEKKQRKNIIFYYRSDYFRTWNGRKQHSNIIRLFSFLRPFFSNQVDFIVSGDKDKKKFPTWIKDERIRSFSNESDFYYNELFDSTLICFGLTGSHMLFPSLFSACTVHLLPYFKYKNMAEDIVANVHSNEILSAYKHLYYNGNYNCSDINPKKLASDSLIFFQGFVEKEYKTGLYAQSQHQWIAENYPDFNYLKVSEYRKDANAKQNFKIRMRRLIDKYIYAAGN